MEIHLSLPELHGVARPESGVAPVVVELRRVDPILEHLNQVCGELRHGWTMLHYLLPNHCGLIVNGRQVVPIVHLAIRRIGQVV